ncbi:hypothetical protein [Maribacter sp. ACAM166]|uniref:hypothetical protein n=1 Tax=Maribacter sp. ACAM166 TaxID=2508996 RepID=UPI0010FF2604|nr:hypothetical protein [Maribacter sp. ACAM166]TLP80355.1 hypothetical protein ES765_07785 [Maribacter sp. ACAM166]
MNRSRRIVSKQLIIALGLLMTGGLFGQKESKTFQERFIVAENAVLDINTSYADIEFETWDKDEVAITATITLEGATKEEAEDYFKNSPFEILGNSKEITITSKSMNNRLFTSHDSHFDFDHNDLRIEIPEIASFVMNMPQIAPFPTMPPLPKTEAFSFDYEAYQKDGDKYMKKWQKNFEKSFDKEHQKRLEEWASKMEEQADEMEKRMEEQNEERVKQMEERAELMEQRLEKRAEQREQRMAERDSVREQVFIRRDSLINAPHIFYYATDGEQKNYKIKKTIKIKLPKSTRIKMDVRHGEVKLAENTKNLNANLSHSSLWASTIDGADTHVSASYTPVSVQKWNYGQLSTSYSEEISLSEVVQLQLQATSSEVTIDKLLKNALVKNSFGAVHILEMGTNFEELDVSVKNGALNITLPKVATKLYVKGNSSTLKVPASLKLEQAKNGTTTISKGFHLNENSNRSVVITSDYSEVVIH